MNINIHALINGFVLSITTAQGKTEIFYPFEQYEELQKEVANVISEFEANRREWIAKNQKPQS